MEGINIIGVQFRRAGKLYDFSSGDNDLRIGDQVIVDTDRGPSLAQVARIRFEEASARGDRVLKPILRRATKKELDKKSRLSEDEVTRLTKNQVDQLELKMKVLKSEVQFGGSKVVVYFTAPGRIDFRNLVKELAAQLKTRVELKQVGARDETKLLGGLGICGREYCCSTFLREFVPVSIRMAKNQNLALNPSKVSGGCGRLLCCLTYEDDVYTELRQKIPPRGTKVKIIDRGDIGIVIRSDVLNQLVLVESENGQQNLIAIKDIEVVSKSAQLDEDTDLGREEWGDDIDLALLTRVDNNQVDQGGRSSPRDSKQSQNRDGSQQRDASQSRNRPQAKRAQGDRVPSPGKPQGERPQSSPREPGEANKPQRSARGERSGRGRSRDGEGQGQRSNNSPRGRDGQKENQRNREPKKP